MDSRAGRVGVQMHGADVIACMPDGKRMAYSFDMRVCVCVCVLFAFIATNKLLSVVRPNEMRFSAREARHFGTHATGRLHTKSTAHIPESTKMSTRVCVLRELYSVRRAEARHRSMARALVRTQSAKV